MTGLDEGEPGYIEALPAYGHRLPDRDAGIGAAIAMTCYVYILGSDGLGGRRTYVGWTTDPERRLAQHNAGTGARSTRGRTWTILYLEPCHDRGAAMSREWHLKRDRNFRRRVWPG